VKFKEVHDSINLSFFSKSLWCSRRLVYDKLF